MPRAGRAGLCLLLGAMSVLPAMIPAAPSAGYDRLLGQRSSRQQAARPGVSSNWSGYARLRIVVTSVAGSWRVPTVPSAGRTAYSDSWVGVDGINSKELLQVGTGQDTRLGRSHYYAWWEVLPAPETRITSMSVSPGDTMTATITRLSGDRWIITLRDVTTARSWSGQERYDGAGATAEWIEEAPIVDGDQTTLADFDTVTFSSARLDGANAHLLASQSIEMVDAGGVIAHPSAPGPASDGFSVTYGRLREP